MPSTQLETHGITNPRDVHWNRGAPALYEEAVIAESGPLVCLTGDHTGRAPNDKFLVKEPSSDKNVWWGSVNRPVEPEQFSLLREAVLNSVPALSGALDHVEYQRDPVFNIEVPVSCPNVDAEILSPRGTWDRDADYDVQALTLAGMFGETFKAFASEADMDVTRAGPFS